MGLKLLMENLKKRATDSPDTPEKSTGYRRKAPIHAGCTPDTCDTPHLSDTCVNAQYGQFFEAVTDPMEPVKQTFLEHAGAWLELDQAYQLHHFKCQTCIAAGLGYGLRCGVGASMWTAYQTVI